MYADGGDGDGQRFNLCMSTSAPSAFMPVHPSCPPTGPARYAWAAPTVAASELAPFDESRAAAPARRAAVATAAVGTAAVAAAVAFSDAAATAAPSTTPVVVGEGAAAVQGGWPCQRHPAAAPAAVATAPTAASVHSTAGLFRP